MTPPRQHDPPPHRTEDDASYAISRAGLGSLPIVGAAAAELFAWIVTPPLEQRRQAWMTEVGSGLRDHEDRIGRLEDLASNDSFIDTALQASRAAVATSSSEKREALRNAVLNAARPSAPEDVLQRIFVNYVDEFTEWHLRILELFDDPIHWFEVQGRDAPSRHSGSLSHILERAYPELKGQRQLYDQLVKDLHGRGLLGVDSLHSMMTGSGLLEKRTTPMGRDFLAFISEPKDEAP